MPGLRFVVFMGLFLRDIDFFVYWFIPWEIAKLKTQFGIKDSGITVWANLLYDGDGMKVLV